ncbi:MAG: polysaccharide biosynthesis/export family protein [Erythrobacteraceae bacterium]
MPEFPMNDLSTASRGLTFNAPLARRLTALTLSLLLSACTSLGASGPSAGRVLSSWETEILGTRVRIANIDTALVDHLAEQPQSRGFAEVLGESPPVGTVIGHGDIVGVTVWEAPPAVLFGMLGSGAQAGPAMISTGRSSEISPQMVDDTGRITLPFVGTIEVAGRTPRQVEEIVRRGLEGIANQAQVLVTISANTSANVTVVGEVASSARVPLTARGERLLDVIAAVGGVKQEINRVTIQVTRDATVSTMPLEQLVRNPRHNVRLRPDDVVAAYYQPFSFTALGASGANAEIPFEASGISLAQALGRINGLQDNRANPSGVFIFRWEAPDALAGGVESALTTPRSDATVPVIYRIDLTDPATFFAAQRFPLRNRDILYVSNAPGVDLQKFVTVLSQGAFSIIGITNAIAPQN